MAFLTLTPSIDEYNNQQQALLVTSQLTTIPNPFPNNKWFSSIAPFRYDAHLYMRILPTTSIHLPSHMCVYLFFQWLGHIFTSCILRHPRTLHSVKHSHSWLLLILFSFRSPFFSFSFRAFGNSNSYFHSIFYSIAPESDVISHTSDCHTIDSYRFRYEIIFSSPFRRYRTSSYSFCFRRLFFLHFVCEGESTGAKIRRRSIYFISLWYFFLYL